MALGRGHNWCLSGVRFYSGGTQIGALALVSLLLAGQLVASILIDHYGWLGFPVQKMNIQRLLGVMLLVGGFLLVRKI